MGDADSLKENTSKTAAFKVRVNVVRVTKLPYIYYVYKIPKASQV